ncbi:hypothetical protein BHU11_10690 [Tannerella sp. oral taxon 808]|nr:hypothetical protein BHU11_10690 [Tannerella sp. oral taxon 808]
MKKLLALLLFPLLVAACTKEGGEASEISAGITLQIIDAQNQDLLDPASTSPKAVDLSKVKVYYIREGKEVLFYRENMDGPRGFQLIKPQLGHSHYGLLLGLDCESKEKVTTTILEWGDGRRDVFKTEFYRQSEPSLQILQQKIWLNGELIWDNNRDSGKTPIYKFTR